MLFFGSLPSLQAGFLRLLQVRLQCFWLFLAGFSWNRDCEEPALCEGQKCSKMTNGAELEKIEADIDVKCCSCYTQGTKRVWEASLSSLKSKRVKGSHQTDCETESIMGLDSGSGSERTDPCFNKCPLGISKSCSFVGVTSTNPLTSHCMEDNAKEGRTINMASEALGSKELPSKRESIRIMLMNIADDAKKMHLTKVYPIYVVHSKVNHILM